MTNFEKVNPKQSFPQLEEAILKFWNENNIFEKSIENRADAEEFNFYDGPPFATGTPHYGHILAGTIKDVIPRYQTMKGKKVERKFGWDTHGLPIENIVEKKLEIKGKEDLEERIGVHTFNETCRENVFGYVDEWEKIVNRMGRWVDMENDYKTMDTDFMESVWWVFAQMHKKGLIYEGHRVVPYSVGMSTPLSNFEVNQGYKDKQDKTATVKFKVQGSENKYILAWTTTPWTLVANLGLAVGTDIDYVELLDTETKETYILAKDRIGDYYKLPKDGSLESEAFTLVREYKGSCLVGTKYEALFPDFVEQLEAGIDLGNDIFLGKNAFSVIEGHHVTTESGTGVVHIAPAYGEDDYQIGQEQDLGFVIHIGDSGKTYNLLENNGVWVFDYNEQVLEQLKTENKIVKISTINHSYPHCWRSGVPLIYKAISAWYVDVTQIKDEMVKNNKNIKWVPGDIKDGRMGKWLKGARDWNISRNRYWGSAIPVWQSEDKEEQVVIGSIEELYQANKDYGQMTKIIFVRHGDIQKDDYTQLSQLGNQQAERLISEFKNTKINAIYSSDTERTKNTVTPLAKEKNIEVQLTNQIGELNWDRQKIPAYHGDFSKKLSGEGSESMQEAYERIKKFLQEISNNHKGETVVIASHGFPIILGQLALKDLQGQELIESFNKSERLDNTSTSISNMYATHYVYTNTGQEVDLHKHFVDEIFVKHPETGNKLTRIPEVLDCWFESGSMPYASKHFMGKDLENFKFPADFIAEGLDQTRGWFYTLIIIGTALFGVAPMKNVIVNGIILAEDGKKMSKSLKNYPDPNHVFDAYGADAMRFYLLNSPVVEAQDFRFAESGVEEVVKKVILPLWNTYYFFTTYANIDNFEPKKGSLYFVRHGETDNNKYGRVNGGESDVDLNENGIKQAHETGKKLQAMGMKFDKIIVSPMLRAKHTAEIINSYLGDVEVEIEDGLKEYNYGEFGGQTFEDIAKSYNLENSTLGIYTHIFEHKNTEGLENFIKRVDTTFKKIEKDNDGKNILIVGHGGGKKALVNAKNNPDYDTKKYIQTYAPKNSEICNLQSLKSNILDKWLISELNELTKEVRNAFDNYELNKATKPIFKFMDNLTNWYIRRSRKRFWKSENDGDKIEAYETLYYTLVELSKIIAPFMPFISDHIYRELVRDENTSVHLTNFPTYDESAIDLELNNNTDTIQKIITLGLAWRANRKIRVRQPLSSITVTEKFSDFYEEILKEELNVKEILVVDGEKIAKKICKPNGRAIGPKFGKDVKFIMQEAKAGNFEELENGDVLIPPSNSPLSKGGETEIPLLDKEGLGEVSQNSSSFEQRGFILETGDFELEYIKADETSEIEAGFGMVISMNPEITPELEKEGFARDMVRHIQEARKEADYNVEDRIQISLSSSDEVLTAVITEFKNYIENETLSSFAEITSADFEKTIEIEGKSFDLRLRR